MMWEIQLLVLDLSLSLPVIFFLSLVLLLDFLHECPTTRGGRKRKRNTRNTSTLDISDVDIIVYDFTLTKAGHLRKSTIDIFKEKLPSLQSGSSRRQTRSATYNLESEHLVYDEDNALIGTSEDDEEESSLYIRRTLVVKLVI